MTYNNIFDNLNDDILNIIYSKILYPQPHYLLEEIRDTYFYKGKLVSFKNEVAKIRSFILKYNTNMITTLLRLLLVKQKFINEYDLNTCSDYEASTIVKPIFTNIIKNKLDNKYNKKKIIIIIEDILHSIPRNNLHKVMNKVYFD